jgi:hypothetical protein
MNTSENKKPDLAPEGFAMIRNGIREHYRAGKLSLCDLGLFTFLNLECRWDTGVYHGTAEGISFALDRTVNKEQVKRYLRRLREKRYINYKEGTGSRGGYDILIHKFRPRLGKLVGTELNAWKHEGEAKPAYEPITAEGTGEGTGAASREGTAQGSAAASLFQKEPEGTRSEQEVTSRDFASRETGQQASPETTRETLDPVRTIENFVEDLKTFIHPQAYQGDALFDSLDTLYKGADDGQEFLRSLVWFNDLRASGTMAPHFQTLKATAQYNQKAVITKVFPEILAKYRAADVPKSKAFEVED